MKTLLRILYSWIILPLAFVLVHISGLINTKVRRALLARYGIFSIAKKWKRSSRQNKPIVMFHSASMGEFEHIKPLISKLHEKHDLSIVLTFFSPSGYEHVKQARGVDLILYAPFDFKFIWKKLYKLINPKFLVISKHDAWPNQIWTAEELNIPTYLVNASLRSKSSRVKPIPRYFLKYVYRSISVIYSISKRDEKNFNTFFPACRAKFYGDTKFDQVLIRKKAAIEKKHVPDNWFKKATVGLFGSIWSEDWEIIKPAIKQIFEKNPGLKLILVPHQPDKKTVENLVNDFGKKQTIKFTKLKKIAEERVLIVDVVGVLADLYKYADISYVGGSFRQGIHNVMEPAIYQIPVIHGPLYKNSYEAVKLLEFGGSRVVTNIEEMKKTFETFISKPEIRIQTGKKAKEYAMMNTGATEKLVKDWDNLFMT